MSNNKMTELCYPNSYKRTNGDRIRSMTDEELAEFLSGSCPKIHPENHFKDCMVDNTDEWNLTENECRNCWLTWLKQEGET